MSENPGPTEPRTPAVARRSVLAGAAAGTGALALGLGPLGAAADAAGRVGAGYFAHGVASGDPHPTSVILWTRLTPTRDATPGSGNGPAATVRWQVAHDRDFRRIAREGSFVTGPGRDHTVKLEATGLRPDTGYFYRFLFRGAASRTGRTRTAPAAHASPGNLRLGIVSCANLQAGWFSAYRHLAHRDDLHAVVHLGDYLYEYGPGEYGYGNGNVDVRPHRPAHEMVGLADYRQRHAQYKRDPDLQDLHARNPFIVTWDDHEVANDAWRHGAENHQPDEGSFQARRRAAHRAYDEWMPARLGDTPDLHDGTRLFRRFRFGDLAELSMLDLRSYRSQQDQAKVSDPERTLTGDAQMRWLKDGLVRSNARWKLVGNPVMISPVVFPPLPHDVTAAVDDVTGLLPEDGVPYNVDQWDGYTHDRHELLGHLHRHRVRDAVFLTGDIHSAWANDLPLDAGTYPVSPSVATEFVGTSVTSNNLKDITGTPPRTTSLGVEAAIQTANRHVKYLDFDDHGYGVLDVTRERTQMDYFVIGDRRDPHAGVSWSASWATRAGSQRVHPVDRPVR